MLARSKIPVIVALLAGLFFATGCATTQPQQPEPQAQKKQGQERPEEREKPDKKQDKPDGERDEKVPELRGSKIKHEFENLDRTAYIVLTKETLTTVAKTRDGDGEMKCTAIRNVVEWDGDKARFPAGTEWTFTKVSGTEMDVTFPGTDTGVPEKIVRYVKTNDKILKGCDVIKTNDPGVGGGKPEKSI